MYQFMPIAGHSKRVVHFYGPLKGNYEALPSLRGWQLFSMKARSGVGRIDRRGAVLELRGSMGWMGVTEVKTLRVLR